MVDVFADAVNKIKVYEDRGMYECMVPSTKLLTAVLSKMKDNSYIKDFEEVQNGKFKSIRITLSKKINDIGVIKPRYAVTKDDIQKYEMRYIPSIHFGMLIVSTSKGIMTNREARESKLGGRLIAYIY